MVETITPLAWFFQGVGVFEANRNEKKTGKNTEIHSEKANMFSPKWDEGLYCFWSITKKW